MKNLSREECKKTMLSILKYIDDICKKNSIPYSIMYGTLIGAIRHGGMIPWDDDIDIALRREDYYKLTKIIESDNNSKYKVLTWENDRKYCFPWAKVVDTTTVLNEKGKVVSDNYGLFVDIFPYDLIPKKHRKILYLKRKIIFFFIKSFDFDKNYKEARYYTFKLFRNKITNLIGKNYFFRKYDKLCKRYNGKDYLESASPFMFKSLRAIKNSEFDNLRRVKFDGVEVNAFNNYDKILREYYGDYMKMPPENERQNHNLTAYWREDI